MPCAFPLASGWGGGEGFKFAMRALSMGRINIASCSLGTAQQASTMPWSMCSSAPAIRASDQRIPERAVSPGRHGHRARRRPPAGAPGGRQTR